MKFAYEKFKNDRYDICTQDELAEKAGISVAIIKNMESGRKKVKPDDEYLVELCNVLNLNPDNYWLRETRVVAMFSNKGGSGKSSITAGICDVMANDMKLRILMIDSDQQMNLTKNFGMLEHPYADTKNLYTAFANQDSIKNYIINTEYNNLDIVISHYNIGKLEPSLPSLSYREKRFRNIIEEVKNDGVYDYIFVDCNPTLSIWNNIILSGCDSVIIPLECTPFGFGGVENVVSYVLETKKEMYEAGRLNLDILGIVISKFDRRIKMSESIAEITAKMFEQEGYLFDTKIPIDVSVTKSQSEEKPLSQSFGKSNVYMAFQKLAEEVVKRG